jgi:hypothetical protein
VITFADDERFGLSVVGQRRLEGNTSIGRLGGGFQSHPPPSIYEISLLLSGRQQGTSLLVTAGPSSVTK